MATFLEKLKESFEKIPTKTRFLKDLGLGNCYTGFTYFVQGRKDTPAPKLMKLLTEEIDYDYVLVPVKRNEAHSKLKEQLETDFINDVDAYLKKYENDEGRFYLKNYGGESVTASAIKAFDEDDILDPSKKIDVSDLF